MIESFHFLRPLWLLGVPVAILLWYSIRKARDPMRGWRGAMDEALLEAVTLGRDPKARWWGARSLAAAIVASVAVAGPTWRYEPSPFDDPSPVLILLRAGESMDQDDLLPSRLERAHLKIADFAEARKGKALGLMAYAGSAHLVLPPTQDTDVVATMAANISPEIMPEEGDDLATALLAGQRTLAETGGSILVVADDAAGSGQIARLQLDLPVHILAITRETGPERERLDSVASALNASLTVMTADGADIETLVRRTARAPAFIEGDGSGNRWAEDGWWLVPIVALLLLTRFRRERHLQPAESVS